MDHMTHNLVQNKDQGWVALRELLSNTLLVVSI